MSLRIEKYTNDHGREVFRVWSGPHITGEYSEGVNSDTRRWEDGIDRTIRHLRLPKANRPFMNEGPTYDNLSAEEVERFEQERLRPLSELEKQ